MDRKRLTQSWVDLFPEADLDAIMWRYHWVIGHYEAPGRFFHDLSHPDNLLQLAARFFPDAPRSVLLALWLHDLVYAPGSPYSEEDSAAGAALILPDLGVERLEVEAVCEIVADTKHHLAANPLEEIVFDLDLYSLGDRPELYSEGSALIRREYGAFSDAEYVYGRKIFVDSMLQRSQIYVTTSIRAAREDQARSNLKNEWTELTAA